MIQNKFLGVALVTILLLLVPLIAMQFTTEVNWTMSDFVVIGALIFVVGSLYVMALSKTKKTLQRVAVSAAFALAFLYIWAELAVGIFTNLGS